MGLDMYLEKEYYIGGEYDYRYVTGEVRLNLDGEKFVLPGKRVSKIVERVGYWRKANAIHGWFVEHVQDGKDECQRSFVSFEDLMKLKKTCEEVLKTGKPEKLMPNVGFFFGSYEIDEDYWQDLKDTIEILGKLEEGADYYYQASW